MSNKVAIRRLQTGISGLDVLLGGGLPEYSFNMLAGSPGAGKTTLAHQIMFSLAGPDCRALYFTVLGEPPLKMLRYQQQFSFFDIDKINRCVKFINLAEDLLLGDFDRVLARIADEVKAFTPELVFVDSFRSLMRSSKTPSLNIADQQHFVQLLGAQMTSWQATSFLIGEYENADTDANPVFTVADGIIWLTQMRHHESMVRKIQIVKMRGQAHRPGLHTFRIDEDGLKIFPRTILGPDKLRAPDLSGHQRQSMGVPMLDRMMQGGVPVAYSCLLVGPTGSGKTVLSTQFLAEGVRAGEPGVIAAFEKSPNQLLSLQLNTLIKNGQVGMVDTRALDLSIDETLFDLVAMIDKMKAKRVVIDSLSGFELALASVFRENFRESLYRLVAVLTDMGVTVLMTAELEDRYTDLRFSSYGSAFLADAIVVLRYVETAGQLKRVISVVKVRGSDHSKEIRFFDIVDGQIDIGETLEDYHGILSGQAVKNPEQ